MAFFVRRTFFALTALKQPPRKYSTILRTFHCTRLKSAQSNIFLSKSASPLLLQSRNTLHINNRRGYRQQTYTAGTENRSFRRQLLYGAGIFGGTVIAINLILNRETREDGGMPPYERSYLNDTFMHTGLGIGIIATAARALHTNGWSYRLMATSPWVVLGLGLVGSIGTMYGCIATSPENYVVKYGLWGAFNITQAALLSPLMFLQPALLARAGLYTIGMMGSIALVGATARQEKYLYLGGPLLAGVTIVALSGLAPFVVPATAARTLMWTENIWLYGGLVVFGGFTLYDVQKILHHARMAERGLMKRDAVNESISLELDFINIFIRMVQILGLQQNKRK